jgi:hypothetical protein
MHRCLRIGSLINILFAKRARCSMSNQISRGIIQTISHPILTWPLLAGSEDWMIFNCHRGKRSACFSWYEGNTPTPGLHRFKCMHISTRSTWWIVQPVSPVIRLCRSVSIPLFWSNEIPSKNFPLYFKIPFVLIYFLSKRNGRYEDKPCSPGYFAKNFFRSWQTLSTFWELILCRLQQRCTNYWEDPQFREYFVIKLSDVKSGSRTLNPAI